MGKSFFMESSGFEYDLNEAKSRLIAKQMSAFCPNSLSIDDLKFSEIKSKSDPAISGKSELDTKVFIPPSPSVSTISKINHTSSKFSYLLMSPKRGQKSPALAKMKYELPNVTKINPVTRNLRPLTIISFSNNDITGKLKGSSEITDSIKPNIDIIIPDARRILTECSSSDEEQ